MERAREALADLEGREAELRSIDETHEMWAEAARAVLGMRGCENIPGEGWPLLEVFEEEMAELPVRTDHGSASGVKYCLKVAARTGDFCFHTAVTLQVVVQDLTLDADSRSVLPC